MKLEPFALERWQSKWENSVKHNLSESGVHRMSVQELLGPGEADEVLSQGLSYGYSNGSDALRAAVTAQYPGARPDQVVVTNGSAEANFVSAWRVVEPGDEVVMVLPNYMQLHGLFQAFGARIVPVHLREVDGWSLDLDLLRRSVNPKTRLIAVCNPNNPTGAILSEAEMAGLVEAAARHGSWLLADEVYRGAEREGPETLSFWGRYDRLFVTCGLSKAYGLPGLRIGWVVSPRETAGELWARKDYTSIFPSILSDLLARKALAMRDRILERTRGILRANWPGMAEWLSRNQHILTTAPSKAGAIVYARYNLKMGSTELIEHLKDEEDVLIVAGDHFGMDGFLRIGYGNEPADLQAALAKLTAFLERHAEEARVSALPMRA
jgi:aspartate/methionine/tyrosine aminotransferase